MAQLEEITSEDLGFKLASEGDGWALFDEGVDLEKFDNSTLNLLAIGNKNKLIAASNGKQLVLGNSEEMVSLKKLNVPDITQVFFNYDETKLLLNRGGDLFQILVEKYLQGDDTMTKINADVTSFTPSGINDDILVFKQGNIYIGDKIIEKVAVYTWADDQYCYITHNEQDKIQFSNGKSIPIQSDILDRDFHPQDLIYLSKDKFFIAYESNESNLQDHEIESFINDHGNMIQADLAPPFGYVGRTATYYSTLLFDWIPTKQFSLITSSCSSDINMLNLSPLESISQSEDTNRAQFPLEDGDDTTPIGFALDLAQLNTTVKQPVQGVEEATGKLPLLYALLNTGKLISWWIFDKTELINNNVNLKAALDEDIKYKNGTNRTKSDVADIQIPESTKETANPFGNSDPFANNSQQEQQQQQSEQTAFGQSSFGNATSSGAFGSFGAKKTFGSFESKVSQSNSPFATKATEASGTFGKTGFGTSATSAPLSFTQPSSGSGFGQTSFGQQKQTSGSVFGGSGFGTSTATSGFAKMATTSGGFGSLAASTSDSPFAKLNADTKSSPFDIFNNGPKSDDIFANKGASSFGQPSEHPKPSQTFSQSEKKSSPFDSFEMKKDSFEDLGNSQGSSFVNLGDLDESLNSSTQEAERKNDLLSSFGAFGKSSSNPTDSTFGNFGKPPTQTQRSNFDKPLTSNTESPFAKFSAPATSQSSPGFGKPAAPVESVRTDTNKVSPFDSLKMKESTETIKEPGSLKQQPFSVSKTPSFSINTDKSMVSSLAPSITPSRQGSPVPDIQKTKGPGSLNKFEKQNRHTPYVEFLDSEADSFPQSSVPQSEQESTCDDEYSLKSNEDEYDEEINEVELLDNRQPIEEEMFLSYDGPTQVEVQHPNKIGQQIINIINQTSGQLKIVAKNLGILRRKLEYQNGPTTELTFDALEVQDKWILADDPSDLIASTQVDLNNHIDEIYSLPGKLEEIIGKIEKNQTARMRIDQLFAQLIEFTSENTKRKLQNRKLDLPNSILRTSLRTKLANVTQQEQELRKKLMSLKAKRSSTTEMISNLESVILQLNGNIRHHLDNVNDLSLQIENLSINKNSPQLITELGHSMVPGVKSRWALAKKHSQTKIVPEKVQFT